MWDSTPTPLPLDAYVDAWHGQRAVEWIERYDRQEPFFLFVGFPGPHDPWDAPAEAVARYEDVDVSMPASTRRPDTESTGRYGALLNAFAWVSDSETMTDAAIRGMRRAYAADISVIDRAVCDIVDALERTGKADNTWIIYTSDHGEMGGNHGLMSKCVLYEPAVRVPLIIRPPGGCPQRVVDALVEHLDVPATVRAIAGAPDVAHSEGRSLLGSLHATSDVPRRDVAVSELVVDEDALTACQLFDLTEDPAEDYNLLPDPAGAAMAEEILDAHVRPFFRTAPARPIPSFFTGGYD
jgi:arylsulfatase A-like enzyme